MTRFAFNGRYVLSHRSVVHVFTALDPVRSLSVYEPGARGGCAGGDHRAFTTTSAQNYGCIFATNAGYFNTTTGECHGNIISDGRIVQVHDAQQPCFGIRADGSIAVGYLPVEEVRREDNPYVQMVCGVVWLVRNGESFVASSLNIEADYPPIQETGTPHVFSTTITGRTIIGHDARGVVKIFQFDGISYYTGCVAYALSLLQCELTQHTSLDLTILADVLIREHNFVNAINLDGGGSSTAVSNGTLVNAPSDYCPNSTVCYCPAALLSNATACYAYCHQMRCERQVTTILCLHEPHCNHHTGCGVFGRCDSGECVCDAGWEGDKCDVMLCNDGAGCSVNGTCVNGTCQCDAGIGGLFCDELLCNHGDGCGMHGVCQDGACRCFAGWIGSICLIEEVRAPMVPPYWQAGECSCEYDRCRAHSHPFSRNDSCPGRSAQPAAQPVHDVHAAEATAATRRGLPA